MTFQITLQKLFAYSMRRKFPGRFFFVTKRKNPILFARGQFTAYKNILKLMTEETSSAPKSRRKPVRGKLNLTIHPEIKEFAVALANARRDTVSQLFEDLVEAEWNRVHGIMPVYPPPRIIAMSTTAFRAAPPAPTHPLL
jgi:hypothetical protein